MAAHTPDDQAPSGDDSHIFRRSKPNPEVPPEEPVELLEFEEIPPADLDADDLGVLGESPSGDSPSGIARRGYREGSSVNLGGTKPGESGSSIFAGSEALGPSAPGSGWFDSIPPVNRAIPPAGTASPPSDGPGGSQVVDDLFEGLDTDSTTVPVAGWQEQQATNSVTESEVIR